MVHIKKRQTKKKLFNKKKFFKKKQKKKIIKTGPQSSTSSQLSRGEAHLPHPGLARPLPTSPARMNVLKLFKGSLASRAFFMLFPLPGVASVACAPHRGANSPFRFQLSSPFL